MPLPAIAAGALKIGAVLGKVAGATVKGVAAGAKTMGKVGVKAGKSAAKGTKSFGKSISKSSTNLKKSISNRTKSEKKIRKSIFDFAKKQKQRRDRRRAEENLEKSNQAKKKPDAQKGLMGGGNPLMKVIGFISTILIGWVVNNLPKIIEDIKNFINKIKDFFENFTKYLPNFEDFFKGVSGFISKTWDTISNLKFENSEGGISKLMENLKGGFTNLKKKIGEGIGIMKKREQEDPKKLAKEGNLFSDQGPQKVEGTPDFDAINTDIKKSGDDSSKSEKEFKDKLKDLENIDFEKELSGESGDKNKSTAREKLIPDYTSTDKNGKKKIDVEKVTGGKVAPPVTGITTTKTNSQLRREWDPEFGKGSRDEIFTNPSIVPLNSTGDKSELIISKAQTQSTLSITPERKGQDIVIIDEEAPPTVSSSPNRGSSTILILEKNSLNNLMKQQVLTELAYT